MKATRVSVGAAALFLMVDMAHGAEAPPGASSCSGCHAATSDGGPVRPLVGLPQGEIVDAMIAFKSGRRAATIMDRIAKGFSDQAIAAIAAWYAAQKP